MSSSVVSLQPVFVQDIPVAPTTAQDWSHRNVLLRTSHISSSETREDQSSGRRHGQLFLQSVGIDKEEQSRTSRPPALHLLRHPDADADADADRGRSVADCSEEELRGRTLHSDQNRL